MGTGLMTDRYELTMLSAFLTDGSADRPAVFECFSRRLPTGRRYGVVAGLGRLLEDLEEFRFDAGELDYLVGSGTITAQCADYLAAFDLRGVDVDAYREGELYFPGSPVLTVSGTLGQGVVLETLVLSVLNHDSAVASAAARMSVAAGGRPLVEMGSRRTHEQAAIAAARAAYLAGFTSTSNLAAGRRYGIPTVGTAAHAFTMAYATEQAAFASQVAAHGTGTTLLVDTYDIEQGIRNAIEVAGTGLAAVRIDSGDLDKEARKARVLLDSLGASQTRILATSDLDEFVITALGDAPVDSFGVGTRVVTGSGHATAEFVYKLVEIDGRPVAKASEGKVSHGGRKHASRELADGLAIREVLSTKGNGPGRPLQVRVVRDGSVVHRPSLEEIRTHHLAARSELSGEALAMSDGPPALEGVLS
ncbi:MAG: nicotinate phosphoribosyltransferase [Frankiales bacterium]|nr:nicotinate phosphoribosyltransferase [Frankiales bacterium]